MKRLIKNLGYRRSDEMERYIIIRSQRNSYVFLVICLLIWSLYESYKVYAFHSRLNLLPCLLLVAALIVQTFSKLIMTRNAVKDDTDSNETRPLAGIIILACVTASVAATLITAFLIMGIRS